MKAELRKELEKIINATVNDKPKQANEAFHNYIKAKTKEILGEAKCTDDMEDKPKKDKKGKKSNPFAKQDKDYSDDSSDDISDDDSSDDSSDDNISDDNKKKEKIKRSI